MAFTLNGQPISIDRPYTAPNGTKYANLRDPVVRSALGVVEVPDPERYDERFYWGVGNPKQLEDIEVTPEEGESYVQKGLKSQWIAQVKDTAGKMLAQTDWMVIRKAERDVAIPEGVVSTRAAIIAEADRLETAIAGCADVEALIAMVGSQDWPKA
jgi:hypothetical protein